MARPEPLGSECTHCGWGQRAPRAANSVTHLPECCSEALLLCFEKFLYMYKFAYIHVRRPEVNLGHHSSGTVHCLFLKYKISHWEILRSPSRQDWLANESPGSASLCLASITKWYYKCWDYKMLGLQKFTASPGAPHWF